MGDVFGSEDVLPSYEFLKTFIMMVTKMKDYVRLDLDDDDVDDADFRYDYRDTMIAQFKQDSYKQNFSLQDHGKCDQIDTPQNRIKFRPIIFEMGVPKPDTFYDSDYSDEGLDHCVRGAEIPPDIRELKKLLYVPRYK